MQIIKVGLINGKSQTKGCESAPNSILNAFKEIETNEKGEVISYNKLDFEEIHVNPLNLEESDYLIYENSKEIFERNFFSIFLGGDHSISFPILRAFNKLEKNPLLILFDAHLDCLESGKIPSNFSWLRKLIESGFSCSNMVLISTRNITTSEIEFLNENKILLIKMDIIEEDLEGVCDAIMERARESSGFYISIDIDSVDPGFAPGTGFLEPGGLSSRDLIYFIKRLKLLKNLKGCDIVEINPSLDTRGITVKLGAKILSELI
jgi:agmatinase